MYTTTNVGSSFGRRAAQAPLGGGQAAGSVTVGDAGLRRILLERTSFGTTRADRQEVEALGYDPWLERQLEPETIPDPDLDARLSAFPWIGRTAAELRQGYGGGGWRLQEDSKAIRILRARYSKRVLFERLVDLWNDLFNVPFSAQDANYLRPVYEEHVIRRRALGHFPDLLTAVATSPAMGAFLDQDSNVSGQPNENYARELLELHTLGEGSGYTENDVREVARCFTGWGYVRHWESGEFGSFRFDPARHDDGAKVVLGHSIPAGGGEADGQHVLRILARDPRTASRVAARLVGWFLGSEAASGQVSRLGTPLVDRVRDVYLATGGDLRAMLRETLAQDSLRAAQPWRRRKLKQPFHYALSFLRGADIAITNATTAIYGIAGLGQVPFEWPDPDGYPDEPQAWASTLAPRWRFASLVLNGWTSWSSVSPADLTALCGGAPPSQWGRCISAALTGGALEVADVERIQAFVSGSPSPGDADLIGAFELAASSPSFQTF